MSTTRVRARDPSLAHAQRQGAHVEEMQRRRLLLAIGELLAEGGVEAATVGSISKRAGVSRRTFYEAFEDREQCFLAALEQAVERIAQEVVPVYVGEGRWRVRVRAALTALLEHFDAHPGVACMCVIETLRAGPEVLEYRKRVLAALVAAVDEGRAEARHGSDPLPLTAEGVVGGALAVIHARLLAGRLALHPSSVPVGAAAGKADPRAEGEVGAPLAGLTNALTGMILHPYLGPALARRELERPEPKTPSPVVDDGRKDPFNGLSIRFTYRTARVLAMIAADPGASNRLIAESSGIGDEGQMSRLLRRLEGAGLVENVGEGHTRGEPNAWWLTARGEAIHATLVGAVSTAD